MKSFIKTLGKTSSRLSIILVATVGLTQPIWSNGLPAAPFTEGADIFKATCAICHGADGSGNTSIGKKYKLRDLRSDEVLQQSDESLQELIARGKGKMPSWEKKLGPGEIRQLVIWLRKQAEDSKNGVKQ